MKILCICANGCNMDIFVARVNNYNTLQKFTRCHILLLLLLYTV